MKDRHEQRLTSSYHRRGDEWSERGRLGSSEAPPQKATYVRSRPAVRQNADLVPCAIHLTSNLSSTPVLSASVYHLIDCIAHLSLHSHIVPCPASVVCWTDAALSAIQSPFTLALGLYSVHDL